MIANIKKKLLYLKVLGFTGVVASIKALATSRTSTFSRRVPGESHSVRLRALTSDISTFRQIFIYEEYALQGYRDAKAIVDAGANIGLASVYFATKFPAATILSIEPEASNFKLLKTNTEAFPNVTAVQGALWNETTQIMLVDPGLGKWGFMTFSPKSTDTPSASCERVQAYTVSEIMRRFDLPKIDILKIDIEGAEKEVFEDSASWLDHVETVIVELHESMKPGCNRSFYMGSQGFEVEWQQGENVFLSRTYRP